MKNKVSFAAFTASAATFLYAYFFIIAKDPKGASLMLLILGLAFVDLSQGLYGKLREVDPTVARMASAFATLGGFGMILHGGYDLANAINPPGTMDTGLPSQIDPRGLASFGLTGLGTLKFAWLLWKDKGFPKYVSQLGLLSGAVFIIIYLGRLIVLSPANPLLLYSVLAGGFVINPLWFLVLGKALREKKM